MLLSVTSPLDKFHLNDIFELIVLFSTPLTLALYKRARSGGLQGPSRTIAPRHIGKFLADRYM